MTSSRIAAPPAHLAYLAHDNPQKPAVGRRHRDVIERVDGQVWFWWQNHGQWFHVYDVAISPRGVIKRVPYESERTTHRIFVIATGGQWRYKLGATETRGIAVPTLARQRAAARYYDGKNQHGSSPR